MYKNARFILPTVNQRCLDVEMFNYKHSTHNSFSYEKCLYCRVISTYV